MTPTTARRNALLAKLRTFGSDGAVVSELVGYEIPGREMTVRADLYVLAAQLRAERFLRPGRSGRIGWRAVG
jgi:hypothetical protein